MRYELKPIDVEFKSHLLTVPCVRTSVDNGDTSSTIVFRIQHKPSGQCNDPTPTKIKMALQFSFPNALTASNLFCLDIYSRI